MKTKVCKKCGIEKELDQFEKRKTAKDGYRNQCKACKKARTKELYKNKSQENITHKVCNKCGENKSIDNFVTDVRTKDGYKNQCKDCVRIVKKKHYEENREELLIKAKEYRDTHKEERSIGYKNWYEKNKEEVLTKKKEYRDNNKDKIYAYNKDYYHKNKESERIRYKEYYEENKEYLFYKQRVRYYNNRENRLNRFANRLAEYID